MISFSSTIKVVNEKESNSLERAVDCSSMGVSEFEQSEYGMH